MFTFLLSRAKLLSTPRGHADKTARVRSYLDETVNPALRRGMRELVRVKPDDPLQFLADFLIASK